MGELVGVREKTIEDYIRELANPELTKDGKEADRIIAMLRKEREELAERTGHYLANLEKEISRLSIEIKALVEYIQFKSFTENE